MGQRPSFARSLLPQPRHVTMTVGAAATTAVFTSTLVLDLMVPDFTMVCCGLGRCKLIRLSVKFT